MPRIIDTHLGYLMIDHRDSPGVPDELVRQIRAETGKDIPFAPGGVLTEADTYSCPHCQAVVIKNPLRTRPRNVCRKCMSVVCDTPSCILECTPFQQLLDKFMTWGAKLVGAE